MSTKNIYLLIYGIHGFLFSLFLYFIVSGFGDLTTFGFDATLPKDPIWDYLSWVIPLIVFVYSIISGYFNGKNKTDVSRMDRWIFIITTTLLAIPVAYLVYGQIMINIVNGRHM